MEKLCREEEYGMAAMPTLYPQIFISIRNLQTHFVAF